MGHRACHTRLHQGLLVQASLVTWATGGGYDGGDEEVLSSAALLARRAETRVRLPNLVRRCGRSWSYQWIKYEATYAVRREILWSKSTPSLNCLEE